MMTSSNNNTVNNISFFAWNTRANLSVSKPFIDKNAYGCDFICLSDHGLFECEKHKLLDFYSDYECLPKFSKHLKNIDFNTKKGVGGCALLWKKSLDNCIRPLPDKGSDRICVVHVTINRCNYFVIGVYLPHQTCKIDDFKLELSILHDLLIEFNSLGSILLMGDTNCHFGMSYSPRSFGNTTCHAGKLGSVIYSCKMEIVDLCDMCTGPNYTWMSENGQHRSYIDHIAISKSLMPFVKSCRILEDEFFNKSDHLAIICNVNISYSSVDPKPKSRIQWNKLSESDRKDLYTAPLEVKVESLLNEYEVDTNPIETWDDLSYFENINVENVLLRLAEIMMDLSADLPKSKYSKHLKPFWKISDSLKTATREQKLASKLYIEAGRPTDPLNATRIHYKDAKRNFRAERRRAELRYEKENIEKLAKTGEIDLRFFWWLVNKKRKRMFSPIYSESGELLTHPDLIRNEWTEYFRDLFSDKIDPKWDANFRSYVNEFVNDLSVDDKVELEGGPITESEVCRQIAKMSNGKSPGWDEISVEHYRYSGEKTVSCVTWVLNVIVYQEKIPAYCKKGILIPIPKAGKDSTKKDNNRGLTLLPVIYKVLEKILIDRESDWLHDSSVINQIQSAGQRQCSSLHTSFLTQEVIAYYRNNGMTVFELFLDAHKAFDSVWIKGLLYKLHAKGLSQKCWRLIRDGYSDFQCTVSIGNETGIYFSIYRGVHQGAPFSMWLYMVFVNDLIEELGSCGHGLCINNINVTSPAHADDITMLTIYKTCMNYLLQIAVQYSRKWQYDYNESKTKYLTYGNDKQSQIVVRMAGIDIELVDSYKHVGITLCTNRSAMKLYVSKRISSAQTKLLAARGLGSHNIPVGVSVLNKIYWSVVIPSLTYGFDVQPIEDSDISDLEASHRKKC